MFQLKPKPRTKKHNWIWKNWQTHKYRSQKHLESSKRKAKKGNVLQNQKPNFVHAFFDETQNTFSSDIRARKKAILFFNYFINYRTGIDKGRSTTCRIACPMLRRWSTTSRGQSRPDKATTVSTGNSLKNLSFSSAQRTTKQSSQIILF